MSTNVLSNVPQLGPGSNKEWWVKKAQWWLTDKNRWHTNFHPGAIDGTFAGITARACKRAKWALGYPLDQCTGTYGPALHSFLVPRFLHRNDGTIDRNPYYRPLPRRYAARRLLRKGRVNPFHEPPPAPIVPWPFRSRAIGELNGCPFQGTHNIGNWESDNAVDLNVPVGTPVIAVWDGVIGSQIGPLSSTDPALFGNRLHLKRDDGRDSYYAHLSRLNVRAGQRVKRGELLGWSGSANGVPHLHFSVEPPGRPDDFLHIRGCQ